jgi:hypothetical protein
LWWTSMSEVAARVQAGAAGEEGAA